jgi:hypothetical protein
VSGTPVLVSIPHVVADAAVESVFDRAPVCGRAPPAA